VSVAAPIPLPPATGGIAPTTSLLALAGVMEVLLLLFAGVKLRRPRD
jgi:hypothetical protein